MRSSFRIQLYESLIMKYILPVNQIFISIIQIKKLPMSHQANSKMTVSRNAVRNDIETCFISAEICSESEDLNGGVVLIDLSY